MFGLFPVSQVAYLAPEVNLASMQCFHSWWTWLTAPEGYDHLHWLSVDPRLSPLVGTPIGDFQRWRPHASNFHHSTRKSTFRTFSFLPSTLFDQFIDWPDFSPFFYLSYVYGYDKNVIDPFFHIITHCLTINNKVFFGAKIPKSSLEFSRQKCWKIEKSQIRVKLEKKSSNWKENLHYIARM